jgi:hypothetical protein
MEQTRGESQIDGRDRNEERSKGMELRQVSKGWNSVEESVKGMEQNLGECLSKGWNRKFENSVKEMGQK